LEVYEPSGAGGEICQDLFSRKERAVKQLAFEFLQFLSEYFSPDTAKARSSLLNFPMRFVHSLLPLEFNFTAMLVGWIFE